jgi:hypothetical protein
MLVATQANRTSDDVVLQRPEDLRLAIAVPHSAAACAGAAASYLLRRIAYRAGAYAPGIQEHLFHDVSTPLNGTSIDSVAEWFRRNVSGLQEIGYRFSARRVAERTPGILAWVREGTGYRGAVLPATYPRLHNGTSTFEGDMSSYAVGIGVDRLDGAGRDDLVMIDPWPGGGGARDRLPVPNGLDAAHRERNYHAIIFYWAGWS